ncbi:NACHT domain-containing protein [Candidatus Methylobacter oryzae]|uniref:ATP-binding protein n=1 Tax=Candidatus Methylobacter oryzae TaxID=2497749 RepID=A0ABY3CE13_9GAMM|nr:hypothetical protein [Candidatus Methylobacter oryzae]TRX00764.1 hypothetical protein EKO24_005435 [Candidatus Methylobacter oryzae]
MAYIDLNRNFVPIKKDEEIDLDVGRYWGKRIGGWLDWDALLNKQRVVILAEASSGKTAEFKGAADKIRNTGKAAFFIPIEELADEGFEQSLNPDDVSLFENWKHSLNEGYFFLDSVDEARLNHKSFEKALKKFAHAVLQHLPRCRIFISCRVTDWRGMEDYQVIKQLLPLPDHNNLQTPEIAPEVALLAPLFKERGTSKQVEEKKDDEITIVRLAPLDNEQQRTLAQEHGIENVSQFCSAIWQQGLENLAERPGDLLELANYWKSHQKFDSLLEMTEHAVNQKLTERDPHRTDNDVLNLKKAREGAERIATALTLGKTFTLQASDSTPSADVLQPEKLLPEWTDAKRNALLRRGIFAPATYGRIRFHHRSTQEYLTAQWLKRLLQQGCPRSEVFKLLFAEVYGVKTVVPSLKPIAAWLALSQDDIRDEILKRDPLILIQHGDPGSVPVKTRCRLLHAYAEKHETGDIANDSLDHRALWMFAHPDLANTIREVWHRCDQDDFRGDLIRLIREGAIAACNDLATQVAEDTKARDYHRIVAVQALNKFNSTTTLSTIAEKLVQDAPNISARLTAGFVKELFPDYLNIEQLIALIADSQAPARNSTHELSYALEELWEKCPAEWKIRFIGGLAELALLKPVDEYRHISKKYGFLADNFEPIARQVIVDLGHNDPTNELIRFLMAIERVEHSSSFRELKPSLSELVQTSPKVQRALFWADVAEARENWTDTEPPIQYRAIYPYEKALWEFGVADLPWLIDDLKERSLMDDKRIVLNAIVQILKHVNDEYDVEKIKESLHRYVQNFPLLTEDLENYFKPQQESDGMREYRLRRELRKKKERDERSETETSWLKFRTSLILDPNQLSNPDQHLKCIKNLTRWLQFETNHETTKAARYWHLIKQAFNNEVAEAYRDAMKALWRDVKPERPERKAHQVTFKWLTVYAYAGIGIEADENARWAIQLTSDEAKRAAEYACMSEKGYPDWLDTLLDAHPTVVTPIIAKAFRSEWTSARSGHSDFLYHYRNSEKPLYPEIASKLFEIMNKTNPGILHSLKCGLKIFQQMTLSESQKKHLKKRSINQFDYFLGCDDREFAICYLVLLFQVAPAYALQKMEAWIAATKPEAQNELATQIIGGVFNRDDCWSLKDTPIQILKTLVSLAYRLIRPAEDIRHDGVFTPDSRDRAESGRSTILSALLNSVGADAYQAMIELADTSEIGERKHRFRQLARGMVERDAELPAWTENETLTFENKHITPIKNGNELYQCILHVLDDIRYGFEQSDASSKQLLSKLAEIKKDDEKSVQNWLAEQLTLRANGRYHVHREVEVADIKEPDIIISGTTGQFEIAIEIKQADSWSPNELKEALTQQLSEYYLKPTNRRHGILFLTDHGRRQWKHPDYQKRLTFIELQTFLSDIAIAIKNNTAGNVKVSVFGIDGTG